MLPYLARGKQLLESFLVLQERSEGGWYWCWQRQRGKRRVRRGDEGKKKWKQGKRLICFFQTLASNFSSLKL
jgi:hypothetical protein